MALLSKKEFAQACKQTTNWLSVYVKRKKIEVDGELIDTTKKINAEFLAKWQAKAGVDGPAVVQKAPEQEKKPTSKGSSTSSSGGDMEDLSETSTDDALTRAKKFAEWQLKNVSIRLAELDEQKKRGELIPTDQVKSIFGTHSRSITTAFKDASDLLVVKISQKKQMSLDEIADIKKELISAINKAVDSAVRVSKMELAKVISEFSQTREVGEHQ